MAWIEQVPVDEATGELRRIYEGGIARVGTVANIIRVMSRRPRSLGNMMRFYVDVMMGESSLTRSEREMLATVTSRANDCFY